MMLTTAWRCWQDAPWEQVLPNPEDDSTDFPRVDASVSGLFIVDLCGFWSDTTVELSIINSLKGGTTPFTRVGSQVQSLSRPPRTGEMRQARSSVAERS